MDGQFNKNSEVTCCFCGESLFVKDAIVLNVQPSVESDEMQTFFRIKNILWKE